MNNDKTYIENNYDSLCFSINKLNSMYNMISEELILSNGIIAPFSCVSLCILNKGIDTIIHLLENEDINLAIEDKEGLLFISLNAKESFNKLIRCDGGRNGNLSLFVDFISNNKPLSLNKINISDNMYELNLSKEYDSVKGVYNYGF